jgi:hypothetical protein
MSRLFAILGLVATPIVMLMTPAAAAPVTFGEISFCAASTLTIKWLGPAPDRLFDCGNRVPSFVFVDALMGPFPNAPTLFHVDITLSGITATMQNGFHPSSLDTIITSIEGPLTPDQCPTCTRFDFDRLLLTTPLTYASAIPNPTEEQLRLLSPRTVPFDVHFPISGLGLGMDAVLPPDCCHTPQRVVITLTLPEDSRVFTFDALEPVPEPATLLLWSTTMAALSLATRGRRRKQM